MGAGWWARVVAWRRRSMGGRWRTSEDDSLLSGVGGVGGSGGGWRGAAGSAAAGSWASWGGGWLGMGGAVGEQHGVPPELAAVRRRCVVLVVGVCILALVLVGRLWQVQVRDGAYYRGLALANRTQAVAVPPVRGVVFDRRGVVLAKSVPRFTVYVQGAGARGARGLDGVGGVVNGGWGLDVTATGIDGAAAGVDGAAGIDGTAGVDGAAGIGGTASIDGTASIGGASSGIDGASSGVDDAVSGEVVVERLIALLSLDGRVVREAWRAGDGSAPVAVARGLSLKQAAAVESRGWALPGVAVAPEPVRAYPLGALAAHVLGYVGPVSETQLALEEFATVAPGGLVGQSGVERVYDAALRGRAGRKIVEVNAFGREKRVVSRVRPVAGDDVYLTIDARLQRVAERLLGDKVGAMVAVDPRSGEVLALVSRPGFDPNGLSGGVSRAAWAALVGDARTPLLNRAVQGMYPPGSTFKVVSAAAVLGAQRSGARWVEVDERVQCLGSFRVGDRTFRDWRREGHGRVDVHEALVESCDVFFYHVGRQVGIEPMVTAARAFGLGARTGIDLPAEAAGLVPSPAWKRRARGDRWYEGETVTVAIGQSYLTVTPLQMAQVIAAVGAGGERFVPRVVRGVRRRMSGTVEVVAPVGLPPVPIDPEDLRVIQLALVGVVSEGTGKQAWSRRVSVAGKTGTAQVATMREDGDEDEDEDATPVELRDHAWFVGYAPAAQPRMAVAVVGEHLGHGGSAAAPLVKKFIEAWAALKDKPDPDDGFPTTGGTGGRRADAGAGDNGDHFRTAVTGDGGDTFSPTAVGVARRADAGAGINGDHVRAAVTSSFPRTRGDACKACKPEGRRTQGVQARRSGGIGGDHLNTTPSGNNGDAA